MKVKGRNNHMVDLLFTIALFFVFAVSSLSVILISSNAYRQIQKQTEINYSARTTLSYIAQNVRQNDTEDQIEIGKLDEHPALIFRKEYRDASYSTYIYEYNGELKELFVKDGISISAADGKSIMEVTGFEMEAIENGLYRFVTTDKSQKEYELVIGSKTSP